MDTLNVEAISSKPVVIIGPSETVTPELRARMKRIVIFVAMDHLKMVSLFFKYCIKGKRTFRGSFGLSVG